MITIPTVLILGAGASAECEFPVGRNFRNRICNLQTNKDYHAETRDLGRRDLATDFLDRFRHSEIGSVDRFLEEYDEYLDVGKYAIAHVLTDIERDENVFKASGTTPSWYEILISSLDLDSNNYKHNALTILTFNYDRSLEYFFWKVFEARYRPDTRKVRRLWEQKPRIIHLHGILGAFDPIDNTGRAYFPAVSHDGPSDELRIAAEGIKIIHEVEADTEEFDAAELALRNAQRIIFLGFGFDKRNVQRLRVFEQKLEDVDIFGTGQGLTNEDHGRIQAEVFDGHTNGRAFTSTDIRDLLLRSQLTKTQAP